MWKYYICPLMLLIAYHYHSFLNIRSKNKGRILKSKIALFNWKLNLEFERYLIVEEFLILQNWFVWKRNCYIIMFNFVHVHMFNYTYYCLHMVYIAQFRHHHLHFEKILWMILTWNSIMTLTPIIKCSGAVIYCLSCLVNCSSFYPKPFVRIIWVIQPWCDELKMQNWTLMTFRLT